MGLLLVGVLIFAVALVLIMAAYTPGADLGPSQSRSALLSSSVRAVFYGEVLFATPMGEGRIGLDCLVDARSGPESLRPLLEPIHVLAHGAILFWGETSLDQVVLGWLSEGATVSAALVDCGERGMRAQLSKGDAFVVLDVMDPHEVGRHIAAAQVAARAR